MEPKITPGLGRVIFLLPPLLHLFMDELGTSTELQRLIISDLFGRKPILYGSIIVFLIGSALCGAARSTAFRSMRLILAMVWLIVARAVQGIGAGTIMGMTQI